jgi:hypothetical protein
MKYRRSLVSFACVACCLAAAGKDKNKVLLPDDVLMAQTVLVVVDPDAGTAIDSPMANRTAQEDVEKALMNWGRFRMAMDASDADLIITVRGVPVNNRPVIFEPSDSGVRIGGHTGTPPDAGEGTSSQPQSPGPQVEAGAAQDMFAVYRGKSDNALNAPAVWRYNEKDGLRSPGVPAVDAFRKVIVEAEKQRAARP